MLALQRQPKSQITTQFVCFEGVRERVQLAKACHNDVLSAALVFNMELQPTLQSIGWFTIYELQSPREHMVM